MVAKELAEGGARVLVLEAGPWLDPDRDFSRLEDDMGGIVDGRLRWGPEDRSKPPWVRRRDGAGLILQASGVGGTTLHYNGISPRAYPAAIDGDWPFGYDELVPWYERVEEFLPVTQVRDLATKDALFAAGCEAIGLGRSDSHEVSEPVWRMCRSAILPIAQMTSGASPRWPNADGCTMCGHCLVGCPHPVGAPLERKAKRATNVSYVPAAMATGNCRIEPDSCATAILFDEPGDGSRPVRIRGVRWRHTATGETGESEARVVVLAGGSIESPRLWLNSSLPNRGGAVGRYLTTHLQDLVTGFFDREVNPDVGQVSMARADFPGYGTLFSQGYGPQSFAIALSGIGQGFWDESTDGEPWDFAGRWLGVDTVRRLRDYHRSLSVLVCTDDESDRSNGISLADDWAPDEHGAVPKVTYHPTARSVERQLWLARKAADILRGAGAREVHRTNVQPALLTHIMGTMRMGGDPSTSVVDADGQAHEVQGLFVGDSSILPNGLGGPNPTLTVQAIAARTARNILDSALN